MSGGAEISSATMSCLCPPECCSPEVEKEDNYVWFLIKVLYGQWIVMGSLAVPIIARLTYLEEELPLVCLVTFLLLLLSVPLVFGNHHHLKPACNCCANEETSVTSEDDSDADEEKNSSTYKLLKKKTRKSSVSSEDEEDEEKKSASYKLLKKKRKKERSVSSSEEEDVKKKSSAYKLISKKKKKKKATSSSSEDEKKMEGEEEHITVKLELEPENEKKADFNLDVKVDPNTPGKQPLTTHLEGQVDGKEMDVEMQGKTKAEGEVGLEGSIQHGKQQDSDSAELDLVRKDEDEAKLRHLSAAAAKKKKENSSSDS